MMTAPRAHKYGAKAAKVGSEKFSSRREARRCTDLQMLARGGEIKDLRRQVKIALIDRGCPDSWTADYFSCLRPRGKAIITNPPYNLINAGDGHGKWLRHTLAMPDWTYLALLLSWDWPAARANGLGELLDAHPFSYAYLMRWKLDFTGEGSPPQRNAWFVWDKCDPRTNCRGAGEPGFRWMDRIDYRQGAFLL